MEWLVSGSGPAPSWATPTTTAPSPAQEPAPTDQSAILAALRAIQSDLSDCKAALSRIDDLEARHARLEARLPASAAAKRKSTRA